MILGNKLLALCVTIDSDTFDWRALSETLRGDMADVDVIVAHNELSEDQRKIVDELYDSQRITTVIASHTHLDTASLLNVAIAATSAPYFVPLRGQGHISNRAIGGALERILALDPFTCAYDSSEGQGAWTIGEAPTFPYQSGALVRTLWHRKMFDTSFGPLRGDRFTALVVTYGDFPHFTHRVLGDILREPEFSKRAELVVGYSKTTPAVLSRLKAQYADGTIQCLIYSHNNLNKSGIHRLAYRLGGGEYVMSVDDDVSLHEGWLREASAFLETNPTFDVAGEIYFIHRNGRCSTQAPYQPIVDRKSWWWGNRLADDKIFFARGGCFFVRRQFVREHRFPDYSMKIDLDDVLLSDLVLQTQGKMVPFHPALSEKLVIDLTPRRGEHNQDGAVR